MAAANTAHPTTPPVGPRVEMHPEMRALRRSLVDEAPGGRIRVESVCAPTVRAGKQLLVLLGYK